MRILFIIIFGTMIFSVSCAGIKKNLKKNRKATVENTSGADIKTVPVEAVAPVKEIEEKLVPVDNKAPDPSHYFVIIGSFRNPENAKKYLVEIGRKGFRPEILRNEAGLYRVSVLATDDITEARREVRRIWDSYSQHSDTWLLIQKK
jgi:cell division protein FtsN